MPYRGIVMNINYEVGSSLLDYLTTHYLTTKKQYLCLTKSYISHYTTASWYL